MTKDKSQDRDRPAAESSTSALPHGSLGGWLRAQREARGVSLRDIADASKISLRYLEGLEQDRLEILPAPIFTKGFLREYARVVGLDPDEVVNLYLLAAAERERASGSGPMDPGPAPVPRTGRATVGPSPLGYGLLLVLAVVVFLAVAALLSLWASRRDQPAPAPAPPERPAAAARIESELAPAAPAVDLVAPAAVALPSPAAAAPDSGSPSPSGPGSRSDSASSSGSGSPPASAPDFAAAPTPPPVGAPATAAVPLRVVLEFTQDCWVELVVDGQRRASELRTAGEVVSLEARDAVLLTLGNTPGVHVEVDGRPFPLPESPFRVVRDLRIDRATAGGSAGAAARP